MPPTRERQAQLDQWAAEFHALIASGMSYSRARARFLRNHPGEVSSRATATLSYLENRVREERAAAGRGRARATRERNRYQRHLQELAAGFTQADGASEGPIEYDPRDTIGIEPSRVQINWTDPRTGADRTSVVYLPLLHGTNLRAAAAAVAHAIALSEGESGYGPRQAALNQAIITAALAGGMRISGQVNFP